jgi:hypothetical protein
MPASEARIRHLVSINISQFLLITNYRICNIHIFAYTYNYLRVVQPINTMRHLEFINPPFIF